MKRIIVLILLMLALLDAAAANDDNGELHISCSKGIDKNVIQLNVFFVFREAATVYSWRGYIYPAVGYFLFPEIKTEDGDVVETERYEKVMPKFPYVSDKETGTRIVYRHPLKLKLKDFDGGLYHGCLYVRLLYDSTSRPDSSSLSKVKLYSNTIRVCK